MHKQIGRKIKAKSSKLYPLNKKFESDKEVKLISNIKYNLNLIDGFLCLIGYTICH